MPTEADRTRHIPNPRNNISSLRGDTEAAPAPTSNTRPRPRPIGKGKSNTKETEIQSDLSIGGPINPDATIPATRKRKRTAKDTGNQASVPEKKGKSSNTIIDNILEATQTVAGATSETPSTGRRGPMPKSAGTRSSTRKITARPAAPAKLSHSASELGPTGSRTGEGPSKTGTTSMGADMPRPLPKPKERPKITLRLPPASADPQPLSGTSPEGNAAAITRAARRSKIASGSKKKSASRRLQSARMKGNPNSGGEVPGNILPRSTEIEGQTETLLIEGLDVTTYTTPKRRGTTCSTIPRRQSARVAARDSLSSIIADVVGVEPSFSCETTHEELRSNASSPLTELGSENEK